MQDAHVDGLAAGVHLNVQQDGALILGLASLFGVFRLDLVEQRGSGDTATHAEHAAADAAAFARAKAAALTGAYATAGTAADTAAGTGAIRSRANPGQRIAIIRATRAIRQFHIGRNDDAGVHDELGVEVVHNRHRGCELPQRLLGQLSLAGSQEGPIPAAATTTRS